VESLIGLDREELENMRLPIQQSLLHLLVTPDGYHACVGSGYCCKQGPCSVAVRKYGSSWVSPCQSLVFVEDDGRYYCGEVLSATPEERDKIVSELHIGAGCCSSLNSDRVPILRRLAEKALASRSQVSQEGR
jgi:hypothetical protein